MGVWHGVDYLCNPKNFIKWNNYKLFKARYYEIRGQKVMLDFDLAEIYQVDFAFTELGVTMLSSVLSSDTAIEVNNKCMQSFLKLLHFVR